MNKTVLWIIGAVVLVAAVGGFFFLNNTPGGITTLGNTSLRSLLSASTSQKCTFDNGQSSGVIYVSAGRMRGDFTSKAGEVTAQSHMIITNNIAYVWIDGMNQGYRMPFEDMASTSGSNNSGVDADARVATNCESWGASDASFNLPTDVSFNAVTPTNTTPTNTGTSSSAGASVDAKATMSYYEQKCAACNAMTDKEAKNQCIAYFDCPAN